MSDYIMDELKKYTLTPEKVKVMSKEEVIEGNILIAQFMGLQRKEPNGTYNLHQWYKPNRDKRKTGTFIGYDESLEYHTSWDWLMPVVEKINKVWWTDLPDVEEETLSENKSKVTELPLSSPITKAWEEVIKFIKWYNTQTRPL